MRSNRKGFTLIELIVVIVIIGVLAAIAAPMMAGNVARARRTEAAAVLGSIRTAERLYFVDNNAYRNVASGGWGVAPLSVYITETDLNGRYYLNNQYSVAGTTVYCNAVGRDGTDDGEITMDLNNGWMTGL